jgi:hypothetical protein
VSLGSFYEAENGVCTTSFEISPRTKATANDLSFVAKLDLAYITETYRPELPAAVTQGNGGQDVKEKKKKTAFDRLVLEEGHKPMILSLIAQHFRDKKAKAGQTDQFDTIKAKVIH